MRLPGWFVCGVLVWALTACGSSSGLDNDASTSADSTTPGPDSGPGPDGGPGPDAMVGELVALSCYELQIGVNVDDPAGEGLVRWYGSLYPVVTGLQVTNVDITALELTADGNTRAFSAQDIVGQHPFDELPAIQERVRGVIALTTEELTTCQTHGPSLHRGVWAATDPVLRMCGTSDQGSWCSETTVDSDAMLRTCHTGLSGLGEGMVDVWDNPQPPPTHWSDFSLTVWTKDAHTLDPVTATELVVHGEGSAQTFTVQDAGGNSCTFDSDHCFSIWHQMDGLFDDTLCPDWQTGWPLELYLVYTGTAGGQPFAGAAPAGQCMTGSP